MVVRGLADRRLLDKHSRERVGAAREIIEEAGKSTRFMTPPTRGFKLLRDSVLSLSLTQDFVRPLYHWRTSRPHAYTDSALNAAGDDKRLWETGPAQGAPPQNVRLGPDDHLLDHLGPGFNLLYATPDAVPSELLAELQAQQQRGLPLKLIAVGAACAVPGADHSLADEEGRLRQRYGMACAGAAYLLRPDHHVCARWQRLDAAGLHAALDAALSFSESHA
jgi:3-(3-hydroxy-phenyl)propionate hydroxylase